MIEKADRFFFSPTSAKPLAALRIGVALTLLLQTFLVSSDFFEWYGTKGILQGSLSEDLSWGLPQMTYVLRQLAEWGISEKLGLTLLGSLYVLVLIALALGWRTRLAAIAAWFLHILFGEGQVTGYGIDLFAHIALFYGMFMPYGAAWSLDVRAGRVSPAPSVGARLSLRIWQIHLAIAYFASGVDKAIGWQWRNGEAIWRSLMLPTYRQYDFSWLAHAPWLATLLGFGTLVIEIGYPFFIFPTRTRPIWITLVLSLHLGIALFLGLHLFALMMGVLTVSCFGVEWAEALTASRPNRKSISQWKSNPLFSAVVGPRKQSARP